MGIGAAMAMLNAQRGLAQGPAPQPGVMTQTGWKNDANRASGNGPIDDPTRQIVGYVSSFSESILTGPVVDALGNIMVDTIAALIAGFESEPARISARLAQANPAGDMKCTVLGYGVTTTPELAAFANGCMVRIRDFNDQGPGGHVSNIISGILAVGEALHSTGTEVLVAVTLGYELVFALGDALGPGIGWDSWPEGPATAMAAGKLMGLNEDQFANALSLTMVPHMPMNVTHIGHLSHWKGCHSPEAIKCAIWSTLLARSGMTGPSKPFEARDGLFDHNGPPRKELRLPASPDGRWNVQKMGHKRFPGVGAVQSMLEVLPQIRAWAKADDIVSIHVEEPFGWWQEDGDAPKWDPRNQSTADHSQPYIIARALIDGEVYLDSYTQEKIMDPAARRLMEKITIAPNPKLRDGDVLLTVRRSGEPAVRQFTAPHAPGSFQTPMTHEEVIAKFNRVCAFRSVADAQRDRALEAWSNLRAVRDIAEPMRNLANFGRPLPL
jgi:2-methylcitrate dehydratase